MRSRTRIALLFVLLAALIVGWLVSSKTEQREPADGSAALRDGGPSAADPLMAIPEGALLVAWFDVRMLRRTALGERLLGRGRRIPGLGLVSEVCRTDPMESVQALAVAIPGEGTDADFAVFATGPLDADALLACAKTVIVRRGGRPVISPMGSFRVLRDASLVEPGPELAVAPGGPVVLGEGSYLRNSIDAVEGRLRNVRQSREHAALRAAVGQGAIVATVVLTDGLRRTLARELTLQGAPESPFAAVSGGGLSIQLGKQVSAHVALRCDGRQACSDLGQLLDRGRDDRAAHLAAQRPELAQLLRRMALRVRGDVVHLGVAVAAEQVPSLIDALVDVSPFQLGGAGGASAAAAALDAGPADRHGTAAAPDAGRDGG
jgi:hypothetical protein